MYKKTYTLEILFESDNEIETLELGEGIYEAISNTLDYTDCIGQYEINIQPENNIY